MRRFMSTMVQKSPRRFAPLRAGSAATGSNSSSSSSSSNLPQLKGVVFDVDGTLCKPQNHMFGEMRSVLNIPKSTDILEHVYSLPSGSGPGSQEEAMESIRAIERTMMVEQVAQPGLVELMSYLDSKGVRKGICTRNFNAPVDHLLEKFLKGSVIEPVVTRDFRPPKPDPAGILFIAKSWGLMRDASSDTSASGGSKSGSDPIAAEVQTSSSDGQVEKAEKAGAKETDAAGDTARMGDASSLIMVGDSIDDMTAGRRAGAATVLLVNEVNKHLAEHEHTDLVVKQLDELVKILEEGFEGRTIS